MKISRTSPSTSPSRSTSPEYETIEWPDYIESQIKPFGSIPFFLGIGNHETVPPLKTREDFLLQFADWLDSPVLRAQRLKDDPNDYRMKTYFHWIDRGVSFYYLDSATADQFDDAQLRWFERTLAKDLADPAVTTIVAGMHKALPESISAGHSMNESPTGTESGRRVYADLLRARDEAHKHVYVLASHSHYFMDGIFNTEYWKQHGGVLPGWIVGTAGAVRYALPPNSSDARQRAGQRVRLAARYRAAQRRNQFRISRSSRKKMFPSPSPPATARISCTGASPKIRRRSKK